MTDICALLRPRASGLWRVKWLENLVKVMPTFVPNARYYGGRSGKGRNLVFREGRIFGPSLLDDEH